MMCNVRTLYNSLEGNRRERLHSLKIQSENAFFSLLNKLICRQHVYFIIKLGGCY